VLRGNHAYTKKSTTAPKATNIFLIFSISF
jgi:hypothetical protein